MKNLKHLISGKLYTCISTHLSLYKKKKKNLIVFVANPKINDSLLLIKIIDCLEDNIQIYECHFLYQDKVLFATMTEELFEDYIMILNEE